MLGLVNCRLSKPQPWGVRANVFIPWGYQIYCCTNSDKSKLASNQLRSEMKLPAGRVEALELSSDGRLKRGTEALARWSPDQFMEEVVYTQGCGTESAQVPTS